MQGDPEIIEILNEALTAELTAINQYFVHAKMQQDWGYLSLAEKTRDESIDEMKHAETIIERILYLEGVPNLQRLGAVRVGQTITEQFRLDLEAEKEALVLYHKGAVLGREKDDIGTAELFEELLVDEEEHIDWLETQLGLIDQLGEALYVSTKLDS